MQNTAQRVHVLKSLNSLLRYLFAASYLVYPSEILLFLRLTLQYSFLLLVAMTGGKTNRLIWLSLPFGGLLTALYRHLVMDRGKAFLLDFVGRESFPNTFTVLSLDVLITVLQVMFCLLFYEQRTSLDEKAAGIRDPTLTKEDLVEIVVRKGSCPSFVFDLRFKRIVHLVRVPHTPTFHSAGRLDELTPSTSSLPLPFNLPVGSFIRRAPRRQSRRPPEPPPPEPGPPVPGGLDVD